MEKITDIINNTEIVVRFSEADSLGIVWHGHYIRYFEDGREAFGEQFGLGYLEVYRQGFTIPVVKIDCDYKRSLIYGDKVLIETTYWNCEAAKLIFTYLLRNARTKEIVATGRSIQVFLNSQGELCLNVPDFILGWKNKVGLSK
ncbi:MAG: acyl-CoA thioesterase [Bacteroidota bacterium]